MQNVLAIKFYREGFFSRDQKVKLKFLEKLQKVMKNKAFYPVLDVEQSAYPFTFKKI